jgi:hypothetical protein
MVLFACTKQETPNAVGWTWGNRYNQVSMPRDLPAPTAVALDVQPVYRTVADSLIHSLLRSAVSRVQTLQTIKNTYSISVVQKGLVFEVSNHTQTHIHWDSCERVISSSQRPLHIKHITKATEKNIYALSGIRTHDPSHQAAEDLLLRPHGHRHWETLVLGKNKFVPKV